MTWIAWLVIALAGLAILGRVLRWLTFWAWVRSIKDPKGRMEAEILWRNYRRSGRRKR